MPSIPTPAPPMHGGGPGAEAHRHDTNQPMQLMLETVPWYGLLYVFIFLLCLRGFTSAWRHYRHKSTTCPSNLADEKQLPWRKALPGVPHLKKGLIHAPLWTRRRAERIRGVGTLPARLQVVVIGIYCLSNLGYLFNLDWEHSQTRSPRLQLIGRSGCAMTANIIPLVIMAARNNPFERLLRVRHDTHILMHRWIGRMICVHLVVHVVCWTVGRVGDGGWQTVGDKVVHSSFITAGFVGFVAAASLFPLSLNSVRRWSYEAFLHLHILLALIFLVSAAVHCYVHRPPLLQLWFFVAALSLWATERLCRVVRQIYRSWTFSSGSSMAVVEALPGTTKACLVTMELRRHLKIRPGAHAYIRLESVEPWSSHPFSIAWVDATLKDDNLGPTEKQEGTDQGAATTVSFIVGAQGGFTRKLFEKASSSPQAILNTRATFEGPYGGHHSLRSYGHVVLFAGATGICHQLRHVRSLVHGHPAATVSVERLVLVWIVRDLEMLAWVSSWLQAIECPPGFLRINIFVTRPANDMLDPAVGASLPVFVSVHAGRPSIPSVLEHEVDRQIGAMCVTVCGPGGLADDVRAAVRYVHNTQQEIDFYEESFSW